MTEESIVADGMMAYKPEDKTVVIQGSTTQSDETPTPDDGTDWKKRYDDHRRWLQQKENEWKEEKERLLDEVRRARPQYTPPKTKEELEAFKKDNPEIYEVAETVAHMQVDSGLKQVQNEIDNLRKKEEKAKKDAALAELKVYHPDFETIRSDKKFQDWAKRQPTQIQDWLFRSLDASLTSKAINLYKMESSAQGNGKPADNSAADMVTTKGNVETGGVQPKIWSTAEIARLSPLQFEKHREDIDLAQQEGRIRN